MRDIIKQTVDKIQSLPEGDLLYCWSGVVFDLTHKVIRADKTFLNVIIRRSEGPLFLRCPTCLCASGCCGRQEPFIRYSLSTVYRVADGPRKGKVVSACDIRQDERYRDAGISKWLKMGSTSDCFSAARSGDQIIARLLEALLEQRGIVTRSVLDTAPLFYTCTNTTPRPRRDQDTLEYMRGFEGYDPILSMEQNVNKLRNQIVMDVGNNKVGFPFSFFYGRGVLAADFSDPERPFGQWWQIPEAEFPESRPAIMIVI
jgi:hypothetical protein